jgi:RNA polymerase sigma-70 factor (ECF subfamily)
MEACPADVLLAKLNAGDDSAIEQTFLAFEQCLRIIVRRSLAPWLRAKFDSVDIVQSIWADTLAGLRQGRWHFSDAEHLRAFLIRVTRNRLINRARHHSVCPENICTEPEAGSAARSPEPRPSQTAQAEELWQRLLGRCPPAYRPLLRWKREGCTVAEMAERSGLHPSSVRRILYQLARRLTVLKRGSAAAAEHGDAKPHDAAD